MKAKGVWLTASLVAMVTGIALLSGCGSLHENRVGPRHGKKPHQGIRVSTWVKIDVGGEQPGLRKMRSDSEIVAGQCATITLLSPTNATVDVKAYQTDVLRNPDDGVNIYLDVPTSPATGKFVTSGTCANQWFDGDDSVTLAGGTAKLLDFKLQNITSRTQITIFALSANGSVGASCCFVAVPASSLRTRSGRR